MPGSHESQVRVSCKRVLWLERWNGIFLMKKLFLQRLTLLLTLLKKYQPAYIHGWIKFWNEVGKIKLLNTRLYLIYSCLIIHWITSWPVAIGCSKIMYQKLTSFFSKDTDWSSTVETGGYQRWIPGLNHLPRKVTNLRLLLHVKSQKLKLFWFKLKVV